MSKKFKSVNFGKINSEIVQQKENINLAKESFSSVDDISDIEENEDIVNIFNEFSKPGQKIFFVSGRAGTGKSFLIRYLRQKIRNTVVVAPTAIAARNIFADTIHSFFHLPPRHIEPRDFSVNKLSRYMSQYSYLDTLIIDEISMVKPSMIDIIDLILKKSKENQKPFGGVNVIFVGDLYQLPPVITSDEEKVFYTNVYKHKYFFSAKAFENNLDLKFLELSKVRRQDAIKEKQFINVLDNIREGENISEAILIINKRYKKECSNIDAINLVPTNSLANSINVKMQKTLGEKIHKFQAIISGGSQYERQQFPAPEVLNISKSSKVIFVKNGPDWINGETGIVTKINTDSIEVVKDISNTTVHVKREEWPVIKYSFNFNKLKLEEQIAYVFKQFPIALGWAITIHKSQGMTLNKVNVNTGNNIFASGQLYVALSRCKSIKGLCLSNKIIAKDVVIDPVIKDFYSMING